MKSAIKKTICTLLILILFISVLSGCEKDDSKAKTEIIILAAASLTDVCQELKEDYEKKNDDIELTFSFGSSGALQTQIEEGAPVDLFISAAAKQMNALKEKSLMDENSIKELLENKVVLVVPKGNPAGITDYASLAEKENIVIALGEPESVPAGQYAKEIFTTLGILDKIKEKANYGSDVRTVLSWVESGDAACGVVYSTDAKSSDKVEVVAEAPEGSCKKVIYPCGIAANSKNEKAAEAFENYLLSDDAMKIFEKYGFKKA